MGYASAPVADFEKHHSVNVENILEAGCRPLCMSARMLESEFRSGL